MTFSFNDVMLLAARYFYTNKIVTSVEKSLERLEISAQSPKTAKEVHHPCRVSITKIKKKTKKQSLEYILALSFCRIDVAEICTGSPSQNLTSME